MSRDEQIQTRGRGAARTVRAVGHAASGGHSLIRNRISREPNTLPHRHRSRDAVDFQEYPKMITVGDQRVRVESAEHEAAAIAEAEPKPRRGRTAKPEADPAE